MGYEVGDSVRVYPTGRDYQAWHGRLGTITDLANDVAVVQFRCERVPGQVLLKKAMFRVSELESASVVDQLAEVVDPKGIPYRAPVPERVERRMEADKKHQVQRRRRLGR